MITSETGFLQRTREATIARLGDVVNGARETAVESESHIVYGPRKKSSVFFFFLSKEKFNLIWNEMYCEHTYQAH